jgi:adenylosuccinate lyase
VRSYPNPYEALKGLTRTNEAIDKKAIHDFIATLQISDIKQNYSKLPVTFRNIKKQHFNVEWNLTKV